MEVNKLITLTTDFGLLDPYVSEMKAVILSISPEARIVDITHNISKFNIRMGAFILSSALNYFPKGTIHVAVVDPGVGSQRRPLLIETKKGFLIGPDNGLLILAAQKQGIKNVYELTNTNLMLNKVSNTFHGRDIFAPAAAYLLKGVTPMTFGPKTNELTKPIFAKVIKTKNTLIGQIIYIDDFGNIITNIPLDKSFQDLIGQKLNIKLSTSNLIIKFCKTYSEVKIGELLITIGSHGFLEISANQNNAGKILNIKPGTEIVVNISR